MVAGITFVVLLTLGAGVAFVLTDALGIRSEASDVPVETSRVANVAAARSRRPSSPSTRRAPRASTWRRAS